MQTIGAFEAKTHFSELLVQVEQGEQVVITRHGKPIAKLVSATTRDRTHIRQAAQGLLRMRERFTLGDLKVKDLIKEGRR